MKQIKMRTMIRQKCGYDQFPVKPANLILVACILFLTGCGPERQEPNILFIICDQMSPRMEDLPKALSAVEL